MKYDGSTEEEARTKWCPVARREPRPAGETQWVTIVEIGHQPPIDRTARCIASDCMAWRWGRWRDEDPHGPLQREGCCGLGGTL